MSGIEIFKALVKARIGLIKNFMKRLLGVNLGLCKSPCIAGDFVNAAGAVLIS